MQGTHMKRLQVKKRMARKVRVKNKLAKRRAKIRAEAVAAKILAEIRMEANDAITELGGTSAEDYLFGGDDNSTENRTDV